MPASVGEPPSVGAVVDGAMNAADVLGRERDIALVGAANDGAPGPERMDEQRALLVEKLQYRHWVPREELVLALFLSSGAGGGAEI